MTTPQSLAACCGCPAKYRWLAERIIASLAERYPEFSSNQLCELGLRGTLQMRALLELHLHGGPAAPKCQVFDLGNGQVSFADQPEHISGPNPLLASAEYRIAQSAMYSLNGTYLPLDSDTLAYVLLRIEQAKKQSPDKSIDSDGGWFIGVAQNAYRDFLMSDHLIPVPATTYRRHLKKETNQAEANGQEPPSIPACVPITQPILDFDVIA